MKVVLLAGGFGTRISEESMYKPKPMIELGGKPILWHSEFKHTVRISAVDHERRFKIAPFHIEAVGMTVKFEFVFFFRHMPVKGFIAIGKFKLIRVPDLSHGTRRSQADNQQAHYPSELFHDTPSLLLFACTVKHQDTVADPVTLSIDSPHNPIPSISIST